MKLFQKTLMLGLVATGLLLAPARAVVAQSASQPAVVVAMASVGEQLNDVQYMMEKSGTGGLFGMVQAQSNQFLNGIDRSRQMGAMMFFSEGQAEPKVLGMIPVKNLDDVLDTISPFVEIEEDGNTYELTPQGSPTMLVRESNGYAFITDNADLFDMIPADPAAVLAGVSADFNVGLRVYVQRIPAEMREQALSAIEDGYREQMDQMGDEDLAELQGANFDMQMQKMRSLINETEELVAGLNIDKNSGSIHLDMQMIGQDGSELARQSENYAAAKPSRFGGFVKDDATFNMNFSGTVAPEDAEEGKKALDNLRSLAVKKLDEDNVSGDERQMLEGVLDDLIAVVKQTMDEGTMDMGAMATVGEVGNNLLAGMQVADPARVEKSVRELVAAAKDKTGGEVEFNLDMGSHDGVKLHEIVVDVANDPQATEMLGSDKARIYFGIGDKVIYFAAGNDPLDALKASISQKSSGTDLVPMQMNMRLAPIMAKVASMQNDDMSMKMADKLEQSGRDRIAFVMKTIKNGLDMRINIEDGVIEMLGVVAASQMGGGGRADF